MFGLIIEAYINQHPVFEVLQYNIFTNQSLIIGSISIYLFFVGVLFFGLSLHFLLYFNFIWKQPALIFILIECIMIASSFVLFHKSYDWSIGRTRYIYLICISSGLTIGVNKIIITKKYLRRIADIISFILCALGITYFLI